jgi:hypothetical protein
MPTSRYSVTCPCCTHEFEVAVSVAVAKVAKDAKAAKDHGATRSRRPRRPRQSRPPIRPALPPTDGEIYAVVLRHDPCSYCGSPPVSQNDHIVPLRRQQDAAGRYVTPHPDRDWDDRTAACAVCNAEKFIAPLLHFLHERNSGELAFGSRAYFWAHPEAPRSLVRLPKWQELASPPAQPSQTLTAKRTALRAPALMGALMDRWDGAPMSQSGLARLLDRGPTDGSVRRAIRAAQDQGLMQRNPEGLWIKTVT